MSSPAITGRLFDLIPEWFSKRTSIRRSIYLNILDKVTFSDGMNGDKF